MPNKATLTVYNESGKPHGWAPVEINEQKCKANTHGVVYLTDKVIKKLIVNRRTIIIWNTLEITEGMKLEAHVRDRTLKILHPQEASPTFLSN